jgi:uncharacterized membrane protein|tara:strand:+ start:106 stop:363 length:258 start_codon:yes stop_codon:yes gene_type:complete
MNVDNALVSVAVAIGFYKMYDAFQNRDELTRKDMKHVLLGIAASLLWLTYQKRNGSDMWATYTAAGLIFQVYIAMYIIASQPTFV